MSGIVQLNRCNDFCTKYFLLFAVILWMYGTNVVLSRSISHPSLLLSSSNVLPILRDEESCKRYVLQKNIYGSVNSEWKSSSFLASEKQVHVSYFECK